MGVRGLRGLAAAIALATTAALFAGAVGPNPAAAATATIGAATLATTPGFATVGAGQGVPVFQGDTSGSYTLSSPVAGTIVSWSFMSAGIANGSTFVLRVLRPADGTGTNWTAEATSPAVSITGSGPGTDVLEGPFTAGVSLPVQAGDRIALEPTNGTDTPTEQGSSGQDGVRFFTAPFADGDTAAIDPASSADNGQVVPVQATVQYTPAPVNAALPVISGTAAVAQTLSCSTGTWSNSPASFAYGWQRDGQAIAGANASSYVVVAADAGHQLTCTVTATNTGGSAAATSAAVAVAASSGGGGGGGGGSGGSGSGGSGSGASGGGSSGGGVAPVPKLAIAPAKAGQPVLFDASGSSAGPGQIARYELTLSGGGASATVECGAQSPVISATHTGAVAGTAVLKVIATSGASASTTMPFTVTAGAIRSGRAAAGAGAAVLSSSCLPAGANPSVGSFRSCRPVALGAEEVRGPLIDMMGSCIQQGNASIVPKSEYDILSGHTFGLHRSLGALDEPVLSATGARAAAIRFTQPPCDPGAPVCDTYYVSSQPVRVNGLEIDPKPGAAIVLAVGADTRQTQFTTRSAAYLVSSDATIYFTVPGSNVRLPLNWSSPVSAGGRVDLDVSYSASHIQQTVASFNLGLIGRSFPAIPIKGVSVVGTLGAIFKLSTVAGSAVPEPQTDLANVKLTLPLSPGAPDPTGAKSKNTATQLQGSVDVVTDNDHGPYIDTLRIALVAGTDFLAAIPLDNLALTYYHDGGPDLPDPANPIPGAIHDPESIVATAQVELLGGKLRGRLEITPSSGSWSGDAIWNDGSIEVVPPALVFLTYASVHIDQNSASGAVDFTALTGDLSVTRTPGGNGPGKGCGLMGFDATAQITWAPLFDLTATTDAGRIFCIPLGGVQQQVEIKQLDANSAIFTIGGSYTFDIPGVLDFTTSATTSAYASTTNPGDAHLQLDAVASASTPINAPVLGVSGGLIDAEVVISDRGIGVCAHVPPFGWDAGAGAHLSPTEWAGILAATLIGPEAPLYIGVYLAAKADYTTATGCNIAQFRTVPPPSGAAARVAAGGSQFDVPAGEKVAIVAIDGAGGAPAVTLSGPGGRTIDATRGAAVNNAGEFVFHPGSAQTVVEIGGANAGRWTITPAPGSPAITSVETSRELPAPTASGAVSGAGAARILRYRIANLPAGTRVVFADRDTRGALVPIASTSRLIGTIHFVPSDLPAGRRTIIALPTGADGVPLPQLTVTTYSGAPPALGSVRAIHVSHEGGSATVAFAPLAGATGYTVVVRLSDGRNLSAQLSGRAHTATFAQVPAAVRVVGVSVQAQRAGRFGPVAHSGG